MLIASYTCLDRRPHRLQFHRGAVIPLSNHSSADAGCGHIGDPKTRNRGFKYCGRTVTIIAGAILNNWYHSTNQLDALAVEEMRICIIIGENRLKSLAFCAARPHIVAVR
jgi:hypothetical protein